MAWHATAFQGVIVGGVIVAASNLFLEWLRGRRDLRGRFLSERRTAYSELLTLADRLIRAQSHVLSVADKLQLMKTRSDELHAALRSFVDNPTLRNDLDGWEVSPDDAAGNFQAMLDLVAPHLPNEEQERLTTLVAEFKALPDQMQTSYEAIETVGEEFTNAKDETFRAFTQVELCATQEVRTAADRLKASLDVGPTDAQAILRRLIEARDQFAQAARIDLGVRG